jgi:hypothetical protein
VPRRRARQAWRLDMYSGLRVLRIPTPSRCDRTSDCATVVGARDLQFADAIVRSAARDFPYGRLGSGFLDNEVSGSPALDLGNVSPALEARTVSCPGVKMAYLGLSGTFGRLGLRSSSRMCAREYAAATRGPIGSSPWLTTTEVEHSGCADFGEGGRLPRLVARATVPECPFRSCRDLDSVLAENRGGMLSSGRDRKDSLRAEEQPLAEPPPSRGASISQDDRECSS